MKPKFPWRPLLLVMAIAAPTTHFFLPGTPADAPHRPNSPASHPRAAAHAPRLGDLAAMAAEDHRNAAWQNRLRSIFRQSLKTDPRGAAALLEPFSGQPSEVMAGLELAASWAEIDPQSAFAWLGSLPASSIRQSWYENAGTALGRIDPLGAVDRANQLAAGWDRREYLKAVVIGWQERDFTAALTWADHLPPGDERNEVLIPLLTTWSQRQPEAAMNYVEHSIPHGRFQEDAIFNVAAAWLKTDPQAMAAWAGTTASGELQHKLGLMVRDHKEGTGLPFSR
ncbi:hypothetical protein [Luteolibacter sp. LG18]|uniref:hypothetical protein n=1 Tax=Luteolibacter sp. LG18 TaxID=2819286 RepID=UPI002B29895F|nr:hypothetical protein llg_42150 [Luteolibacter sp. LG18]